MRILRPLLLLLMAAAPLRAQEDSALIRRALRLHRQVPMVDGHNDLLENVAGRYHSSWDSANIALPHPELMTDIPRLKAGLVGAQFWSIWVPPQPPGRSRALRLGLEQIDLFQQMMARWPGTFEQARTAADIVRIHRHHKVASLIGIEGGHVIENSLGVLRELYELGARYMTLTWNNGQPWADAQSDTVRAHGLSPFGREVIHEMNRLGMLVDLAHVSDSTMVAALQTSEAPVIFSHSSVRALSDVLRNVPDTVLRMVRANGGIVMVNFECDFVDSTFARWRADGSAEVQALWAQFGPDTSRVREAFRAWRAAHPAPPPPPIGRLVDHIDHIRQVAGIDHVGYGSDFDGIDCSPVGLTDVSMFPRLTAELLRRGYSDNDVKKVIGLNFLRVMRQAEQVSARLRRERGPSTATLAGLDSTATRP